MSSISTNDIECPLCLGQGRLQRTQILERLGMRDFARVAQLSAEEACRLLLTKHKQDERAVWVRFEVELAKRTSEFAQLHKDQLHSLTVRTKELETDAKVAEQQKVHEIQHAHRKLEDMLREVGSLRERNHELETEMSKVARIGRREELDFADEARTWAGICVSEKLSKNGDYIEVVTEKSRFHSLTHSLGHFAICSSESNAQIHCTNCALPGIPRINF